MGLIFKTQAYVLTQKKRIEHHEANACDDDPHASTSHHSAASVHPEVSSESQHGVGAGSPLLHEVWSELASEASQGAETKAHPFGTQCSWLEAMDQWEKLLDMIKRQKDRTSDAEKARQMVEKMRPRNVPLSKD